MPWDAKRSNDGNEKEDQMKGKTTVFSGSKVLAVCVLLGFAAAAIPVVISCTTTAGTDVGQGITDGGGSSCTPNDTKECVCSAGQTGVQICSDDGSRWSACDCNEGDLCVNVTCSGHGTCATSGTSAFCDCDSGYHESGLSCEPDNPCAGVTCSGHGTCAVSGGDPICACDDGYHADGLSCPENNPNDPCDGVTCSGHGTCDDSSGNPACDCDSGYAASGLQCLVVDECAGEDCSGHGYCVVSGGNAECICDTGYRKSGLACIPDTDSCSGQTCSGHGTCKVTGGSAWCDCDTGYKENGLTCVKSCQSGPVYSLGDGDNCITVSSAPAGGTLTLTGNLNQFTAMSIALDGNDHGFLECCGIGVPGQCRGDGAFSGTKTITADITSLQMGRADASTSCTSWDLSADLTPGDHTLTLTTDGTISGTLQFGTSTCKTFALGLGDNSISCGISASSGTLTFDADSPQFTAVGLEVDGDDLGMLDCCGIGTVGQCRGNGTDLGHLVYDATSVPLGKTDGSTGCTSTDLTSLLCPGSHTMTVTLWDGTLTGSIKMCP